MDKFIDRNYIYGKIAPPSSKSILQRVFAGAFLSKGQTNIFFNSLCDDSQVVLNIIKSIGAKVENLNGGLKILGGFEPINSELNFGESGLALRMFTPILSLFKEKFSIVTEGSLKNRPANTFVYPLKGGNIDIDGSLSSQFLTGLLFALPLLKEDSVVNVTNLNSKPYIDMTLEVLKSFGVNIINENYEKFIIRGNQSYSAKNITIENDWSGASNFIVAGAIAGNIELENLNLNSYQPDKNILDIVKSVGANVKIRENSVVISKNKLKHFTYDATDSPDLFPPLVVLASVCEGISRIKGISRLRYKEGNRAEVLVNEFIKLGIKISVTGDEMIIEGGNIIGGEINSHNDHRIAMAGALAGLISEKGVNIKNYECVSKSYPDFFKEIERIIK